ncbi:TonB-dependent receptor [Pseudoxanthomonas sacheonensis]|uniref:Iron complex outermembrane receptor protein n=1 Tax=Pseudoxanthomonas sacheonensis TaxID=443615 RepID=A0ABU1RY37_9GAMM|nr:TonB-dependent receptor [Pseudoxanthomonas sacheonensis]MDR6842855.1 iron complex outermembrane receptor protein [Pseudoxanthomonas sacheonensis]
MIYSKLRRASLPAGIALILASPFAAQAQEAAPAEDATTLDKIVVTGSNIPRTSTETASPVQVITRQEIDRTGKNTVAEYLQTITADGAGSIPKSFGNGFAGGGAGVSLRGLGAGSTLVLLNGRRLAPFGLADDGQKVFTDLSTIPLEAVERIDVLKDGASAIYGSDAIAGVVNVILRKDFTGVVVKGSYGTSGDSDGNQRKGSITAGIGDLAEDGYNFFASLEASKTDSIGVSDRRNRKWIGTGDTRPWGYAVGTNLPGRITGGGTGAGGGPSGAVENPNTGLFESLPGCAALSDVTPQDAAGGCLWDVGKFRDLSPQEEYLNFFSRGTFAFNDNAELYTEFSYSKKKTVFHNTPSGVSGAWGYPGGPVNANDPGPGATMLGAGHPDNPFGEAVRLRYTAFDVGPRTVNNESDLVRFLVGVKGTAGAWDYDVGLLHSETSLTNSRKGFLQYSHVLTALSDPNSPVGYWRIGDDSGLNSQALYDYISPTIMAKGETKLDIFDAKASRSLMDMAGGAMGLAVGLEWRKQSVSLTPQTFTDVGDIIGLGYSAYAGTEEVGSAYAELVAPVLESLELNAAVRVDSYKGGETSTTPKFGVKWKPADWIALRGTYAEGFRAPNPAENGTGGLAAFSTANDPVRCAAPGHEPQDCDAGPIALITSPNPDLKPEKSKSYTVGLVLDPTPTTSLTLDAFRIKRTDEIFGGSSDAAIAAGGANVIRGTNDIPGTPNSGTILAVLVGYENASSTTVEGFDFDARQRFDLGNAGKLSLDLQWTRINSFEREDVDGTRHEFAGTHGNCDVTNCIGTPKNRVNFGATWDIGSFSVSSVVNWRDSIKNVSEEADTDCANHFADGTDAPNGCELKSFYTIDLSARWRPTDAWEIFGSVANVTDRIAPLDPLTYGAINYNPLDFSGAIGRYYTIGAKYSFN